MPKRPKKFHTEKEETKNMKKILYGFIFSLILAQLPSLMAYPSTVSMPTHRFNAASKVSAMHAQKPIPGAKVLWGRMKKGVANTVNKVRERVSNAFSSQATRAKKQEKARAQRALQTLRESANWHIMP
jgi:hypothetical protein